MMKSMAGPRERSAQLTNFSTTHLTSPFISRLTSQGKIRPPTEHDVRDELGGGGVPRLQTTPARVASDAPPSWRLDALAKRRSLM